ncbi:MAG: cysteine--tRNA ligase [Candidatus Saccharibacteria bacterium]|nr:cysteine--tRNA ligase [Candidatus Saccharibacteria bacterium]
MRLFNTASKTIETFKPQNPDNVKIYTCGPTVYDYAHVGNYTSYIYWDLLVRTLKANGYTPNRVLNLTDVGHLTSDADEGEDKLEKGARREKMTVWEIAQKYIDYYLENFRKLNLTEPNHICRATDFIEQDESLIDTLIEKGYTYETKDGIYFDTSKFSRYADFAHLDLEGLEAGARVEMNDKHNKTDFALWKFIQPGEDHAMRWDYKDRDGYPGWHIECSTIIHEVLGETIDIHTGGIDHIPIHHTNEIAQSESAFDKKFCNYWLHCNFITIDNQKISKSLGNTYTLEDLEQEGIKPLDFKMWVLSGHFQGTRNFSFEDLRAAGFRRLHWRNLAAKAFQLNQVEEHSEITQKVIDATSDNLNSAEAFAIIDQNSLSLSLTDWQKIDDLFGLGLIPEDIEDDIKYLIHEREEARKNHDFETADRIRDELAGSNISVLDSNDGPIWQFVI